MQCILYYVCLYQNKKNINDINKSKKKISFYFLYNNHKSSVVIRLIAWETLMINQKKPIKTYSVYRHLKRRLKVLFPAVWRPQGIGTRLTFEAWRSTWPVFGTWRSTWSVNRTWLVNWPFRKPGYIPFAGTLRIILQGISQNYT
jgi:hypothetical protein